MLASVHSRGDLAIRPRYAFSRTEVAPGQFDVQDLSFPNTTDSFHAYQLEQISADIKENVCRVSDNVFDEVCCAVTNVVRVGMMTVHPCSGGKRQHSHRGI